jgi:hypothetical protein
MRRSVATLPTRRARRGGGVRHGGTQFGAIPSNRDMRAARRRRPYWVSVSDTDVDPRIAVLEVVLHNMRGALSLRPRQGRQLDTHALRRVLRELKKGKVPLRAWVDPDPHKRGHVYKPAAQRLIERELNLSPDAAIGALRRLADLMAQLPKEWLTY